MNPATPHQETALGKCGNSCAARLVDQARKHGWWVSVFGVSLLFFWVSHARLWDGDGLRYRVWEPGARRVGDSNHLLTETWFSLWWAATGGNSEDAFPDQLRRLQTLNHVAGAASLTVVALLVWMKTRDRVSGVLAAASLGATSAFFYHATQSTEPMMAVFWMLVSWGLLECPSSPPRWRVVASAVAFALCVGSYQSFVLAGFGLIFLAFRDRRAGFIWTGSCVIAGGLVFGIAAWMNGARDSSSVVKYLFGLTASSISNTGPGAEWGSFSPQRLISGTVGLANSIMAILPSEGWPGLRRGIIGLAANERILLIGAVAVTVTGIIAVVWRSLREMRPWSLVPILILGTGAIMAAFWDPYYQKLWLQPLAAFSVLGGVALTSGGGIRRSAWLLPVLIVLANTRGVYLHYTNPDNLKVRTARALEASVRVEDLLITRGWDESEVFAATRRAGPQVFSLINNSSATATLENASKAIKDVHEHGHRVFFYGVIELNEQTWRESVGRFAGIDYPAPQAWRQQARLVWRGDTRRVPGDLYELAPSKPAN